MGTQFVLDTSAFTNLGASRQLNNKKVIEMIALISKAKKKGITCYTTPAVWNETKGILENKKIPCKQINKLDAWVVSKHPSIKEISVPATFIYEYVGEVRERFNRGLREAEKAVLSRGGNRPDELVISELRDNFKASMRKGLLDSKEDLEVLLLAKELKAGIVSVDEGIKKWAKEWGIRFIDARGFAGLLKETC